MLETTFFIGDCGCALYIKDILQQSGTDCNVEVCCVNNKTCAYLKIRRLKIFTQDEVFLIKKIADEYTNGNKN
jgi:hypothetical protein